MSRFPSGESSRWNGLDRSGSELVQEQGEQQDSVRQVVPSGDQSHGRTIYGEGQDRSHEVSILTSVCVCVCALYS